MTINADLHTHTIFSHGKGTPEEVVQAAISKGLKKVAITDHAPSHIFYGIRNVQKYLDTISRLKDRYAGTIEVLAGMELNIISLDGRLGVDEKILDQLDILLFAFHKAVLYRDFKSAAHFYILRKNKADVNTQAYIRTLKANNIHILAHPGYSIPLDHGALAAECAQRGTMVEINASHHEMSLESLKIYMDAGVSFAVSSDAHRAQDVGQFKTAIAFATKAGIEKSRIINAE